MVTGGLLIALGTLFGIVGLRGSSPSPEVVLVLLALVLAPGGTVLYGYGRRLYATGRPRPNDTRPPVLYLRSFGHDRKAGKRQFNIPFFMPSGFLTEEEQLVLALNVVGPALAIGQPGVLDYSGAWRTKVEHGNCWQDEVTSLMDEATLVVIRAAHTEGLLWEVQTAIARVSPTRLIVLLPQAKEEYETFRRHMDDVFPRGLPTFEPPWNAAMSIGGVLWFEPDWVPRTAQVKESYTDSGRAVARALARTFAPVFQQIGITPGPLAPAARRLAAAGVDLVLSLGLVLIFLGIDQLMGIPEDAEIWAAVLGLFLVTLPEITPLRSSIGKRVFDLRVVDNFGMPVSLHRGLVRLCLKLVFVLTAFFLGSIVTIIWTRKSLQDYLSGTIVVQARS